VSRSDGLERAIRTAGGVGALARALGIAQPSVSNWQRIPAERVLAVEALTGVSRDVLRPDLYPTIAAAETDDVDRARAQEYGLLALLLGRAPSADVLANVARLHGDAIAEAAATNSAETVSNEYFSLFVGLGRGELLPYASYYLTGFLHERPLARVREDMAAFGLERTDNVYEPEDHIAILCETMAAIIGRKSDAAAGADRRFFDRHLKPWAARFFADLESAGSAAFYRPIGMLGRLFTEIEDEAFRLDAPDWRASTGENGRGEARSR
jgi:TorA maturation chaperone TorD